MDDIVQEKILEHMEADGLYIDSARQYAFECEECAKMEQDLKDAQTELIFWQTFGKQVLSDIRQMNETDSMFCDVPRTLLEMYRRFTQDLQSKLIQQTEQE